MTPSAPKLTKAYAYLRVSSAGQVDGDGFPRQRAAIEAYSKANGIRIVKYFEEQGISGTKDLENRPALQELMLALMSNGVRVVLIEKLDRLARDLMVQEAIIGDMRKRGFELVSVTEPDLCSDDPSRKLVRQIFGAIAEYDRCMIVLKLRGARQRMRAKTGRCEGRKAYGAREGEQEVISLIRELSARGMNYSAIAERLNADGVSTRYRGAKWYPTNVSRILNRVAA